MNTSANRFANTVYELSNVGRCTALVDKPDVPETSFPKTLERSDNGLPELGELDVARHYLALAQHNFGVENGLYPLGSCTMKYNPKIAEQLSRNPSFSHSHPHQSQSQVQGNLQLMYELQQWLGEIGGFDAVSLHPAAGAHGEFTALLMIRAWHRDHSSTARTRVLVPDSAHGTNPASTAMAGYDVVEIPSDKRGNVDIKALHAACDDRLAALMITNPNTLGLFDENLAEITEAVHACGALVYGDGANMNALTGIVKPSQTGIDLMHYNLHKTFGTPHGGGGPGAGPLAANDKLRDYLPGPLVVHRSELPSARYSTADFDNSDENSDTLEFRALDPSRSIGKLSPYYGNFGVFIRAYCYIRSHGARGLKKNAMHAVLNANYLRVQLKDTYHVPFDRTNMHEFVCEGRFENGDVRATDISKRLMDAGIHPPTNYFPLVVNEALMIEPTECESLQTLDSFIDALIDIATEADENPALIKEAPHTTPVARLDETYAARHLKLQEFVE